MLMENLVKLNLLVPIQIQAHQYDHMIQIVHFQFCQFPFLDVLCDLVIPDYLLAIGLN